MIYSQWQPDRGTYRYLEARERRGLGDDLPTPALPLGTSIGVPSVDAGRKAPAGVRVVGQGEQPLGSVTPASKRGLAGVSGMLDVMPVWGWLALGITLGWALGRRRPKRGMKE